MSFFIIRLFVNVFWQTVTAEDLLCLEVAKKF